MALPTQQDLERYTRMLNNVGEVQPATLQSPPPLVLPRCVACCLLSLACIPRFAHVFTRLSLGGGGNKTRRQQTTGF